MLIADIKAQIEPPTFRGPKKSWAFHALGDAMEPKSTGLFWVVV